jgi:hypothetical protein
MVHDRILIVYMSKMFNCYNMKIHNLLSLICNLVAYYHPQTLYFMVLDRNVLYLIYELILNLEEFELHNVLSMTSINLRIVILLLNIMHALRRSYTVFSNSSNTRHKCFLHRNASSNLTIRDS